MFVTILPMAHTPFTGHTATETETARIKHRPKQLKTQLPLHHTLPLSTQSKGNAQRQSSLPPRQLTTAPDQSPARPAILSYILPRGHTPSTGHIATETETARISRRP